MYLRDGAACTGPQRHASVPQGWSEMPVYLRDGETCQCTSGMERHASVPQGWSCLDDVTTPRLSHPVTLSDEGPTSPSPDPLRSVAWHGSREVHRFRPAVRLERGEMPVPPAVGGDILPLGHQHSGAGWLVGWLAG